MQPLPDCGRSSPLNSKPIARHTLWEWFYLLAFFFLWLFSAPMHVPGKKMTAFTTFWFPADRNRVPDKFPFRFSKIKLPWPSSNPSFTAAPAHIPSLNIARRSSTEQLMPAVKRCTLSSGIMPGLIFLGVSADFPFRRWKLRNLLLL